jgi:N-acetylglucosamine kinase-like BadF-type ATPase
MAGCDRPADRAFIENIVRGCIADRTKILIVNDAVVAMVAVLGRLHGILVIGGTGSIVLGYNDHTGATTRCGGWGHLLGDEGSGYMIGLEALRAIMKEFDGRGQATSLTPRMLAALELKSPTDLIGWTYMSGKGKTEIAALARHVHDEAEAGDAVAKRILAEQAALLAIQVGTVYKRLFGAAGERVSLALWGGNLVNSSGYRETFTAEVGRLGLPLDVVMRDERAVVGAATHMINHL